MSNERKPKWFSSDFLRATPEGAVDESRGVIEGVSVCTVGEAKGHGVNLDSEFIERVAELGAEKNQGLKARFGHPNMCSTALGTFIGRFKNFAVDGNQVRADLCLSNAASDTPHGDLRAYVLGLAQNEPDMFGTSIVFTPGPAYIRGEDGEKVYEFDRNTDEAVFVECDSLHACDAVDEPAANDGLFSQFTGETMAGQITEFLDLHPQVLNAVSENPEILSAIAAHGEKVEEFFNRYREYRATTGEEMNKDNTSAEPQESLETPETPEVTDENLEETPAEPEALETETPAEPSEPELPAEELSEPEQVEPTEPTDETPESFDCAEFVRIADEFGAEVACETVREGGDYESAQAMHADAMAEENKALREELENLRADSNKPGGKPAEVKEVREKKSLFKTQK